MDRTQTFNDFLATSSVPLPIGQFIVNFIIVAILASILSLVYAKYGSSLSNRRAFGRTFALIATTTFLIITIVKSSLALSLGLVGALSIVRFRTALKEPEELAYMFMSIALGLGMGADQRAITTIAFVALVGLVIARKTLSKDTNNTSNLYLTINSESGSGLDLDTMVNILQQHSKTLEMKRFDEDKNMQEAAFLVEFEEFSNLNDAKEALKERDSEVRLTFLDNLGAFM